MIEKIAPTLAIDVVILGKKTNWRGLLAFLSKDWAKISRLIVPFMMYRVEFDDVPFRIRLWNTFDLDEVHHKLSNGIFKTADCILIGFDIANRSSFDSCVEYMERIQLHSSDNISIVIIGTLESDDEKRQVSLGEAAEFAYSHGVKKYLEYRFDKDDLLSYEVNHALLDIFRHKNRIALIAEGKDPDNPNGDSGCNIF